MSVLWTANKNLKPFEVSMMELGLIKKIQNFHRSFTQYDITPLRSLSNLAAQLGVGGIYIKDESYRFGLNSFKALGSTYALSQCMKDKPGKYTFYATTDGNHGRAVAWAAAQIGQKSVIYMPKGSPQIKLDNIRREGAEAHLTDMNYDDTIRHIAELASQIENTVMVQDTAWDGYEDIPTWIMQGYGVMALEACEQLQEQNIKPTHMVIQAGVGAFAGAAQGLVANFYGAENSPTTFVVEPKAADCHYRSALAGEIVKVGGDMATIMAGLACGEPNKLSWDILKNLSSYFISMDDYLAARAMRVLGAPLPGDPRVISGESGASGMGFLLELLINMQDLRKKANIGQDSHILLFSTEGDTDPENYRRIVWDGAYGSDN